MRVSERKKLVECDNKDLSISSQCKLLSISHSSYYHVPKGENILNFAIMESIDKIHLAYPFYGVRRIQKELLNYGFKVGKKLIRMLMQLMAIYVIYPKPNTSKSKLEDKKYPYLLRGLSIERCNQVWEMDITYIHIRHGFMYLAAIIDVRSRLVVGWDISNTMEADWCKEIVEKAIGKYGVPEIFNTDQGSQFTSHIFTNYLLDNKVKISMDGRGRALDNIFIERLWRSVKQENIYLNAYENGQELYTGLREYFDFYNRKRPHQSLDYEVPAKFYENFYKIVA
jgi:putative transposase